MDMSWHGLGRV